MVLLSFVAPVWHFKTSCSPEAQKELERALAMLHSFFFPRR